MVRGGAGGLAVQSEILISWAVSTAIAAKVNCLKSPTLTVNNYCKNNSNISAHFCPVFSQN